MILADKILDLRKKNGWSQEELAEKLNVSRQSISKWESAASIPDIGKILEMAALFGVTTDYLLKDNQEAPEYTSTDETDKRPRVSVAEANEFIGRSIIYGRQIGLGVILCILSPVLLILLTGFAKIEKPVISLSESTAAGIGIVSLFIFIAAAVTIFILSSAGMKRYEYLKSSDFTLEYGVSGIISEKRSKDERKYLYSVTAGVVLCIMSVTPLIIAGLAEASEILLISLVGAMFFMLAFAVYLFISSGMVKSSYDQLLKDGDYKPEKHNKLVERIAGAYWPVVTAIYLGWSFLTLRWDITWIIWPVASLIFAGIAAAIGGGEEK